MQIQVSNLHKSYLDGEGRKLHILRGINFEAESGSTVAILGASGTGKSTFLHTLGTLEGIDEGRLCLDGRDLTLLSRDQAAQFRNEEVGFIFQFHQLLQDFTALENVMIPQLIKGISSETVRTNALELLQKVGLSERTGHKPTQLSGGEQQRVAIARALVNRPRIVLADEPTGNLDEETSAQVMEVLLRLNRENETTLIMITHNTSLASAMQFQHRMENGQLHLLPNA
ncbi:MAG TPA: ABC transporter ATP-binding protein [Candidatus Lambdaproteobacteria bacterium]|nr:ABC transporter ATP-binding protein [Candidatus Lambdaproteobacteria bacterium]HIB94754.1 ABC transporter ATP-binding protein [Candidatus Lambdaproteobacteria bacterium]HIO11038.1 ABC transporter ATP-binding protein [Deltaproteobacteria bacterium]HIO61662.1 ABC transporter ATP-binding protein [Deltaproteobacteria bacterium]HIO83717.1 ABC transporter ATP-binding protein [Deltaproteobacteria bacterium]